jgi:signal transduction histidine kinase
MRRRDVLLDAGLLLGLVAVAAGGGAITVAVHGPAAGSVPLWSAVALQVVTSPVLLFRRRWPVGAAAVLAGSSMLQVGIVLSAAPEPAETFLSVSAWTPIALSVCVETMTERGIGLPRSAPVWVLIGLLTALSIRPWDPEWGVIANGLLHNAVAPLVGLYLAARRRLVSVLRERAERAEREQVLRAEQARAEERRRLATEIHDLVAHRVTLVILQAGALRANAPDAPTRAAAEEMRVNGCRAIDELRELVGVLRRDRYDEAPATDESRVPALSGLAADAAGVGQPVELTEEGDAAQVSAVVGRTVYRVVQEALTNARKHAWGAATRVHVEYRAERIHVTVHNGAGNSRAPESLSGTGGGTGLAGLRERVELIGGRLRAGPDSGGGFRVETVLPARVGR